jgi:pimeloyl-ACP methyl ester carboxylesterase
VIGETAVSTEEVALMPRSRNRLDRRQVYFEDEDGDGVAVVFHGGFLDSVADVRESSIAQTLPAGEFRRIYVDHRGLGARSGFDFDSIFFRCHISVNAVLIEAREALIAATAAHATFSSRGYGCRGSRHGPWYRCSTVILLLAGHDHGSACS